MSLLDVLTPQHASSVCGASVAQATEVDVGSAKLEIPICCLSATAHNLLYPTDSRIGELFSSALLKDMLTQDADTIRDYNILCNLGIS